MRKIQDHHDNSIGPVPFNRGFIVRASHATKPWLLSAALLSVRSAVVSSLHRIVALSPCDGMHSLLLFLGWFVSWQKSKCECKSVGISNGVL